ncbi:Activator of Hsp90 ATPase homolog 1-like protein [Mucilaginibacter sp. OK268]|uniref:SRPBCC family protein n=1 Tax=Mucilaginibacter sp. OK268 TaxID=1881048 RepID=UPI0008809EE1|nr:SRPBCC domain-containing protein [Mucilaginibacter sp. OK268]SDP21452.1 Activator of Hsp90 ATPase homolog 1-like protein [Mucilaginibacter sp. OK268]
MTQEINKTVTISSPVSRVWEVLTNPELIKRWMLDTEINVTTDWQIGSSIIFKGSLEWTDFENKGTILQFEPEKIFQYNYWSTLSGLSDIPGNYIIVGFVLRPIAKQTALTLTLSNITDEITYKHLDFYWTVTLDVFKKLCES